MMQDIGTLTVGNAASGGLVLLDRRVYSASTTWSKPADGAGNLLAGVGRLVIVQQQGGGGGGGFANVGTGSAGGTTSFGSHAEATGGAGGANSQVRPPTGGTGSLRNGAAGQATPYFSGPSRDFIVPGGGLAANCTDNGPQSPGCGGFAVPSGLVMATSGAEGGVSYNVYKIGDLGSTVSVTIGAGGAGGSSGQNNGGAGWMIVETWGTLS